MLATGLFMAAIFMLSALPSEPRPGDASFFILVAATPPSVQKVLHVCFYGILTILWVWTLREVRWVRAKFAAPFLIAVGFGAFMEWLQLFIPGRFSTLSDLLVNALGAAVGLFASALFATR